MKDVLGVSVHPSAIARYVLSETKNERSESANVMNVTRNERISMTAKEWLQRYQNAKKELNRLTQLLAETRANMSNIRAIEYSGMPKATSVNTDLSASMVKIEQMEERIERKQQEQIDILNEIMVVIDQVGDADQRTVLTLRYIHGAGWARISGDMDKDRSTTLRIHGKALENVRKILEYLQIDT